MKKKIFLMLPCIAAVAIATFVGKKTFESHAYEANSLLMQNVEALAKDKENGADRKKGCKTTSEYKIPSEKCMHGYSIGFSGTEYSCSEVGEDSICKRGLDGYHAMCQINPVTHKEEHPTHPYNDVKETKCK